MPLITTPITLYLQNDSVPVTSKHILIGVQEFTLNIPPSLRSKWLNDPNEKDIDLIIRVTYERDKKTNIIHTLVKFSNSDKFKKDSIIGIYESDNLQKYIIEGIAKCALPSDSYYKQLNN